MTNIYDIYKCETCGNILEIVHGGDNFSDCCSQKMTLQEPKKGPEGAEKHIPVVEIVGEKLFVKVGSIQHPMLPEHYIEWIELICGNRSYRKFLLPGQTPEVIFEIGELKAPFLVSIYCNIHGLWDNFTGETDADEKRVKSKQIN